MKRYYFIVYLALQSMLGFAQETYVDSLQQVLRNSSNVEDRVATLIDIGEHYHRTQIYIDSAIFYHERANNLAKEESLVDKELHASFNLGNIYTFIQDFDNAMVFFDRAQVLAKRKNSSGILSSLYNNIGGVHFEMTEYDLAIENYEKALKISLDKDDPKSSAIEYMNIGEVNYIKGDFGEAKVNLERSLTLAKQIGWDPPTVHLFYARTLFATDEIELAELEAKKAFTLSEADKDLRYASESAELLSNISARKNDYALAYKYQDTFVRLKDSLNTAKEINEIQKLKLNFKLDETEKELAYLSEKNSYLNTIYILVVIAVILLVFLVSRQFKVTKMTKEIHDVQTRLIRDELDKRESKRADLATSFDVTVAQDNERRSIGDVDYE